MLFRMNKVLYVEDDPEFQRTARETLAAICDLTIAGTVMEAQLALESEEFDLLLLDIVLPDGNGMVFCQRLRGIPRFQELPIVFCSSQSDVASRIHGLELGADDYVVKPFDPGELRARVAARLRSRSKTTEFENGIFKVDLLGQRALMRHPDGRIETLTLTPIEFKMLVLFLRNEKKLFSREELLEKVWGGTTHVSGHAIETHTSSLRKKIGEASRFLRAVPRKGYYFTFEEDQ